MPNTFVKAQQVVRQLLGLLERDVVLPSMVWRDAVGDFTGAAGDTVTVRVPAYTTARTRQLRGAVPIVVDELSETSISLTLDTHVYKAVGVSDEEMTLDIVDFGEQVTRPVGNSVARGLEDIVAAEMAASVPAITLEVDNTDPYDTLVDARRALNDARVPSDGRGLAVGSGLEAKILKSDHLSNFDLSGSSEAFREAVIGRIAGFTAVSVPALPPNEGYAFHRTAYALSTQAPVVPAGATWGDSATFAGFACRLIRDYDFMNVRDRLLCDIFAGSDVVRDQGYFDANGVWTPFTGSTSTITLALSAAADDIIDTAAPHGFAAGDEVVFPTLTGGTGLVAGRRYFVIAANLAAQTFQVSATLGGAAVNFTTDITAGTTKKGGALQFVRSVKLVDLV